MFSDKRIVRLLSIFLGSFLLFTLPSVGLAEVNRYTDGTATIWQGFAHWWQYNHRLNRLGDYVDSSHTVHTAASGTGPDVADYESRFKHVRAAEVGFRTGVETFEVSGDEGELLSSHRTVAISATRNLRDRDSYEVVLSGFDLVSLRDADKLAELSIKVDDARYDKSADQVLFDVDAELLMKCFTPECEWAAQLVDYRLELHYLIVAGDEGLAVSTRDTPVVDSYWIPATLWTPGWFSSPETARVGFNSSGGGEFDSAVAAFKSIEVGIVGEHHYLTWQSAITDVDYDRSTRSANVDVLLHFNSGPTGWEPGLPPEALASFVLPGQASMKAEIALLEFKQPCVESGSRDSSIDWEGHGADADTDAAVESESFRFPSMDECVGDLDLDVKLVKPYEAFINVEPTSTGVELVRGRKLTYRAKVTNEGDFETPGTNLLLAYQDARSREWVHEEVAVPPLDPGETVRSGGIYVIDVLEDATGGIEEVKALWEVDEATNLVDDSRSDNTVVLRINDEYFKPDYRVQITDAVFLGANPEEPEMLIITARVRNRGTEHAFSTSHVEARRLRQGVIFGIPETTPAGETEIEALSVQERTTVRFLVDITEEICGVDILIDSRDEIDEIREGGTATLSWCHERDEPIVADPEMQSIETLTDYAAEIYEHGAVDLFDPEILLDILDRLRDQGPGPFLPGPGEELYVEVFGPLASDSRVILIQDGDCNTRIEAIVVDTELLAHDDLDATGISDLAATNPLVSFASLLSNGLTP